MNQEQNRNKDLSTNAQMIQCDAPLYLTLN